MSFPSSRLKIGKAVPQSYLDLIGMFQFAHKLLHVKLNWLNDNNLTSELDAVDLSHVPALTIGNSQQLCVLNELLNQFAISLLGGVKKMFHQHYSKKSVFWVYAMFISNNASKSRTVHLVFIGIAVNILIGVFDRLN